ETPYFWPAWVKRFPYGTEARPVATESPAGRTPARGLACSVPVTRRIAGGVGPGERDAEVGEGALDQPGAVQPGLRVGTAEHVRHAEVLLGAGHHGIA